MKIKNIKYYLFYICLLLISNRQHCYCKDFHQHLAPESQNNTKRIIALQDAFLIERTIKKSQSDSLLPQNYTFLATNSLYLKDGLPPSNNISIFKHNKRTIAYINKKNWGVPVVVPIRENITIYTNQISLCRLLSGILIDENQNKYLLMFHIFNDKIDKQFAKLVNDLYLNRLKPICLIYSPNDQFTSLDSNDQQIIEFIKNNYQTKLIIFYHSWLPPGYKASINNEVFSLVPFSLDKEYKRTILNPLGITHIPDAQVIFWSQKQLSMSHLKQIKLNNNITHHSS